ncbi:IclR family transcriptional regulator domain-containing protein [Amycolatopsis jiangsuensis]|uniref:Glycerol operon regulatory protein n=1 Tax=Amycolatopsis jiangsuensis TaxID=1181879 RepID=A0A840IUB4_9PSEU|nr:IclR family transcriptional regulator C-terminal domain-containing protein [Amycolatopsis jiangsuensis]MBB4685383.1 IclR family pca regulon transcriptional regulator [Amycolatopsis jiangsuensis]
MDSDDPAERGAHHVQSLERGLAVIKAFGAEAPHLTLSEVARSTGLTRAAARRFLLTLVDLGYVRTDGKYFSLTARVLELGYAFLAGLSLAELAQPHLERLSAKVRESSSVSVLEIPDIVYVARVAVSRIMTVSINVGTRFPAYATSMGHVLLADMTPFELDMFLGVTDFERLTAHTLTDRDSLKSELAAVARQGWAMVDQELEEGLRSVAAPIYDRSGRAVAAVNISTHASRTSAETARTELVPSLLATAAAISDDLKLSASGQAAHG